jgi:hypothetical protein
MWLGFPLHPNHGQSARVPFQLSGQKLRRLKVHYQPAQFNGATKFILRNRKEAIDQGFPVNMMKISQFTADTNPPIQQSRNH